MSASPESGHPQPDGSLSVAGRQAAVLRCCDALPMSQFGQKRPFSDVRITSAFPPVATE